MGYNIDTYARNSSEKSILQLFVSMHALNY